MKDSWSDGSLANLAGAGGSGWREVLCQTNQQSLGKMTVREENECHKIPAENKSRRKRQWDHPHGREYNEVSRVRFGSRGISPGTGILHQLQALQPLRRVENPCSKACGQYKRIRLVHVPSEDARGGRGIPCCETGATGTESGRVPLCSATPRTLGQVSIPLFQVGGCVTW